MTDKIFDNRLFQTNSAEERAWLNRYPVSLQQAAAAAFGIAPTSRPAASPARE